MGLSLGFSGIPHPSYPRSVLAYSAARDSVGERPDNIWCVRPAETSRTMLVLGDPNYVGVV